MPDIIIPTAKDPKESSIDINFSNPKENKTRIDITIEPQEQVFNSIELKIESIDPPK